MSDDLLPSNATDQERALSAAIDRSLPVIVKQVWNPDDCPVSILPWLAWAFSVDTWNNAWTTAQKRAVIRSSVAVHEVKGTIGALMTSMAALGYNIDVIEWFQETPAADPYTFRLNVTLQDVGLLASDYDQIITAANAAKNLRSQLTGVDTTLISEGSFYFGAAVIMGETITLSGEGPQMAVGEEVLILP